MLWSPQSWIFWARRLWIEIQVRFQIFVFDEKNHFFGILLVKKSTIGNSKNWPICKRFSFSLLKMDDFPLSGVGAPGLPINSYLHKKLRQHAEILLYTWFSMVSAWESTDLNLFRAVCVCWQTYKKIVFCWWSAGRADNSPI